MGRMRITTKRHRVRPFLELLEARLCLSAYYDFHVVAQTGSAFSSLGSGPSINASGQVAFQASVHNAALGATVDNVFAFQPGATNPTKLMQAQYEQPNTGPAPVQTFSETVQITDSGEVLARRTLQAQGKTTGLPPVDVVVPLTYLEKWNANNSAASPAQTVMASGSSLGLAFTTITNPAYANVSPTGLDTLSPFRLIYSESSVNNHGQVVFTAQRDDGTILHTGPHATGFRFLGTAISTGVRPQPSIADTGAFVISNAQPGQNEPGRVIGVFPTYQFGVLQQVANTAKGFTSVGSYPTISDDGQVLAFAGTHASAGTGIFVAIKDPQSGVYQAPSKVVGVSGDGVLDPGEQFVDVNVNGTFDGGEADFGGRKAISFAERINVNRSYPENDAYYSILFEGQDHFTGGNGLYTAEVHLVFPPASGVPIETMTAAPLLVVAEGETLPGLSGAVQQIAVGDGLNTRGKIVFHASLAGGAEAIVTAETRDTDKDGLYDHWETEGIDIDGDGVVELDLPALGAFPDHKNLFIEVDAMAGRAPLQSTLDRVVDAFANAPAALVSNPNGADGIRLHIDYDEQSLSLAAFPNGFQQFNVLKDAHFGTQAQRLNPKVIAAKKLAYRYAIFADSHSGSTSSGLADGIGGNDFMVTLGAWSTPGGTADEQAGTFMHELGHTLGLRHGGGDNIHYKPNYVSVMNYNWQTPKALYLAGWKLDYSRAALATLNEAALNEPAGVGGRLGVLVPVGPPPGGFVYESGPVDWDGDGMVDASPVAVDINHRFAADAASPGEMLVGHEDWSKIVYNFRLTAAFAEGVPAPLDFDELDFETDQLLQGAVAADFDVDGDVDGADFLTWQRGFGTSAGASRASGDTDADGDIDASDLSTWRGTFGAQLPQSQTVATIRTLSAVDAVYGVGDLGHLFYESREYRPSRRLKWQG